MLRNIIEQVKIDQFNEWLNKYESFVIIGHIGPDGDAVGSSLGLWHVLTALGKKVQVIMPNAFPDFLNWMPGSEHILFYSETPEEVEKCIDAADIICLLDFNVLSRIGDMSSFVEKSSALKVMIDHHLHPGDHCDITMSYSKAVATSELVFRLIVQMNLLDKLSKAGAECLYTGMMTDTGGFTYNSNQIEIYTIIGLLLEKGIDKDLIYRRVNNTYSEDRLRLMGHVLTTMKVYPENTALLTLTDEEQDKFNFVKGDSEGFVNIPLSIKNVIFSCLLKEDGELNLIKVSLRSVGTFPCNELAAEFFNGGGHLNASGGEFYGTMEEAIERFEEAVKKYKPLLLA
ncbi:DHH family phosphoesterase [Bacteroides coprosuis]|uniref:DHH family phosphoesterase n=1 Tax=Bacteroides coprosuis TaxID=151276 RepID=UPI001D71A50E|nr:bifunctional oligoribonuclease/PAP phosphatase NrnA [Bacteroides coprosuis]HJD91668.1 bifunctional oligoribonuclease/PAP phosphatase NrnA [Bacteroides coprosuis]